MDIFSVVILQKSNRTAFCSGVLRCERWHPVLNHPLWGSLGHVHYSHPLMPITSATTGPSMRHGFKPNGLMEVFGNDADINVGVNIAPLKLSALFIELAGSVAPIYCILTLMIVAAGHVEIVLCSQTKTSIFAPVQTHGRTHNIWGKDILDFLPLC